jgi:phosphomannomutase
VDESGAETNRNRLVALASVLALKGQEQGIVVTDSVTSDGLKKFIEEKLGGEHYRYQRGYRNVINKAMELCEEGKNAPLAIETSGHAAFRDNYFLDDGAYLITRIIIQLVELKAQGQSLSDLFADLEEPADAKELRYAISESDFRGYGDQVLKELEQFALHTVGFTLAPDNREGIRICADENHGDGWLLLRLSVHDPVMPLNVESRKVGGCDDILKQVQPLIDSFNGLHL